VESTAVHSHTETDATRRNLEAALGLAAASIRIFPAACTANNGSGWRKKPHIEGWQMAATTDREKILRWWRQWPHAVPGIPLKGHVVIDADRHGGADGVAALQKLAGEHGGLPAGPVTETAGGGLHHVFKQPAGKTLGNRRGALPVGIDVRGAGGWIVAPGAVRLDGQRWAPRPGTPQLSDAHMAGAIPEIPAWLVELIEARPRKPARDFGAWAQRALTLVCDEMRRAAEGARNETLNRGAFRLGSIVARGWLDQHQAIDNLSGAALVSGLPPDEVQSTLASGFVAGLKSPAPDPEDRPRETRAPARRGVRHGPNGETRHLVSRRLSDVQMRVIEWVWPGRVALGKHTTLAGEPSVGKSTLLYWIAAAISRGAQWPCGEGTAPKGSVILLSAEDGAEDTIAPRIAAAGGDLSKVHVVTAMKDDEGTRSAFTLKTDLQTLEDKIREIGNVRLVIIDPISSYLGDGIDGHSNTDVRHVVEPLHEMADRLKVAVLTNGHFSKTGAANKSRASHRFIGSIAFIALPRVAFAVVPDPEDEDRRLVLHVKNNIAKAAPGLAFRLIQAKAGDIGEPPGELYAPCVAWDAEHVTMTADQAIAEHEGQLRGEASEQQTPQQREAEECLRSWLAEGPKPATEIEGAAKEAGISQKVLRTVRERICTTSPIKDERGKITGHKWALKPEPERPTGG
jgi:hypothetical protein